MTQKAETVTDVCTPAVFDDHLREFDMTVFLLLSMPMDPSEIDDQSASLRPKELQLLLEDLTKKTQHVLLSSTPKKRFPLQNSGNNGDAFRLLDIYPPASIAKRCVHLFKRLCSHLEAISAYFQNLIEVNDGIMDGPQMYTDTTNRLGRCYGLILHCLCIIISWHELQKTEHVLLLEDSYKALAVRTNSHLEAASLAEYSQSAFAYVEKFSQSVPVFSCAVYHIQLLRAMLKHVPDSQSSAKLAEIGRKYLKRNWNSADGTPEKGIKFHSGLETILQVKKIQTKAEIFFCM